MRRRGDLAQIDEIGSSLRSSQCQASRSDRDSSKRLGGEKEGGPRRDRPLLCVLQRV